MGRTAVFVKEKNPDFPAQIDEVLNVITRREEISLSDYSSELGYFLRTVG